MTKQYKLSNSEIVIILKEVLAAMEVKSYNFFRIRAYQNVITSIEGLTRSVHNMWENGRLDEIVGIGAGLKSQLNELFTTGRVQEFEAIKHDLPEGMFELIGIRGIGAKKAYKLASAFNLTEREFAVQKVLESANSQKIQKLPGFGEKSEQQILDSINELKKTKSEKERKLLIEAEKIADRVVAYLEKHPEIEDAIALGSLRRRNPTVGDLDIAIKTTDSEAAINYFLKYDEIQEVLVSGDQRVSVIMADDMQVDIRVCSNKNYGSMMQYFTGSKAHNIVLRTFSLEKKCSLSEYGIKKSGKLYEFGEEEMFYKFLGLDYIPPELRQGKNEVELAAKNELPDLISISDIKGDLHMHTIASDGINTLNEMAEAAIALEYEYIGIADHSPSIQSRGEEEVAEIIQNTREMVDSFNDAQDKIKVLFGYEVNILADATLSLPDKYLQQLDFAIAGMHSAFNQDKEQLTKRMLAALENPYINIIAHPTGRHINSREACDINWSEFFVAALDNNKIIEINSQPDRLDLPEDLVEDALTRGVKLVINTDSHAKEQLLLIKYGIDVARRGSCKREHIVNTQKLLDLELELKNSSAR